MVAASVLHGQFPQPPPLTPVISTSHSSKQGVQPLPLHSLINHSMGLLFNIPTSSQGRKSQVQTPFRNISLPQDSFAENL